MSMWSEDRGNDGTILYYVESSRVYPERDVEYSGTAILRLSCFDDVLLAWLSLPEEPVRYFDSSGEWEMQEVSWYVATQTGYDDIERVWQAVWVISEFDSLGFLPEGPSRDAYLNFMSDIARKDFLVIAASTFDYGLLTFEFQITGVEEVMAKLLCDVDW